MVDGAAITLNREGNPPIRIDYPEFAAFDATRTTDTRARYMVWELKVRGGKVVSLRTADQVLPTGCLFALPCSPSPTAVQR